MSTPASEVKIAIAAEKATIESRVSALEVTAKTLAKTFYEKHLPLFYALGGAAMGALLMLVKLKL